MPSTIDGRRGTDDVVIRAIIRQVLVRIGEPEIRVASILKIVVEDLVNGLPLPLAQNEST